MVANDRQSLEVTYSHISVKMPTLAIWIAELPSGVLPILNQVAFDLIIELFPLFEQTHKEVYIRIKDLPIEDNLRDLRQVHLNNLIRIKGVVTKRTGIFPQLKKIYFHCGKCGERKGPIYKHANEELNLGQCFRCHSKGPFNLD